MHACNLGKHWRSKGRKKFSFRAWEIYNEIGRKEGGKDKKRGREKRGEREGKEEITQSVASTAIIRVYTVERLITQK